MSIWPQLANKIKSSYRFIYNIYLSCGKVPSKRYIDP